MDHIEPLTIEALCALAPTELRVERDSRYSGTDRSVVLADFGPRDQEIVRAMYDALLTIFGKLSQQPQPEDLPMLQAQLEALSWPEVVERVRELGEDSDASHMLLRQVIHDVRGGSFVAFAVLIQLLELGLMQSEDMLRLFFLARDHLKMMRNAVRDLDPERYARDWEQRLHSVRLIAEKWDGVLYSIGSASATISVAPHYLGNISERCLEFAALDRVLYNLINNAVRFAADEQVRLSILTVDADEHHVRFVVDNAIMPEHRAVLRERFGDELNRVFVDGFTTGGNGLGLQICTGFVANAYGVGADQALERGYLGATLLDDARYVAWFHWPVAAD